MSKHWIAIRGPARVKDMEADDSDIVTDLSVLRRFDGIADPDGAQIADYFDFSKDHHIRGGVLTTVFDELLGLEIESRFAVDDPLGDGLIERLVDNTLGQWADGVGSGDDLISGLPFRACPDRDLVLSVWEDGDTYRLLTSWTSLSTKFRWELNRNDAGQAFRTLRFVE